MGNFVHLGGGEWLNMIVVRRVLDGGLRFHNDNYPSIIICRDDGSETTLYGEARDSILRWLESQAFKQGESSDV